MRLQVNLILISLAVGGLEIASLPAAALAQPGPRISPAEQIATVLRETRPLPRDLGPRLQLYVWPAANLPGGASGVERTLQSLTSRGIAAYSSWTSKPTGESSLAAALRLGALQKGLGLRVNVNATDLVYGVFDGSPETAHIDSEGKQFFDTSSSRTRKLGCPFILKQRFPVIRERIEAFCRAYKAAGLPIDLVFADWEIDGPIEWNGGWEAARKCVRCRRNIPDMEHFESFQRAYRAVRSEIQRECYTSVVLASFPKALVGNYGVYPNDGWRYWYDYYETEAAANVPVHADQRARYRPWVSEFAPSGYTLAMPVVYTWYRTWNWYDYEDGDYRWFYNLLLVGSNSAAHKRSGVPIVSFVHWTTTSPPPHPDPAVKQFSEESYRELLWHLLLRGHDSFFLWCRPEEIGAEIRPLHEVWLSALEYKEFLDHGTPVTFDVPKAAGPVVSGLRLGNRLLVRRTDFSRGAGAGAVLSVDGRKIEIPLSRGRCQILVLPTTGGPDMQKG